MDTETSFNPKIIEQAKQGLKVISNLGETIPSEGDLTKYYQMYEASSQIRNALNLGIPIETIKS